MSELTIKPDNPYSRKYKTTRELYRAFTGFELPMKVTDLPDQLTLPHAAIGDLINTILNQPTTSSKKGELRLLEAVQYTGLLDQFGRAHKTPIFVGYKTMTPLRDALFRVSLYLYPLVPSFVNEFVTYTEFHGDRERRVSKDGSVWYRGGAFLSNGDAAKVIVHSPRSLLSIYAAKDDIKVAVQTVDSMKNRPKFSMVGTGAYIIEPQIYEIGYTNRDLVPNEMLLANYFAAKGVGMYRLNKSSPELSVAALFANGELINGLPLVKINPSASK